MTMLKTHTGAEISREDYLAKFAGTAALAAHKVAADQGVTLSELRRRQVERLNTIGNRNSYAAAIAIHEKNFA